MTTWQQNQYRPGMFGSITKPLRVIADRLTQMVTIGGQLSESLQEARSDVASILTLSDRVASLEGDVHAVVAEAEALIVRAESHLKAARGAEERARGMVNRARALRDDDDEGDEEGADPFLEAGLEFQERNAVGGPAGGVQDVRGSVDLPLDGKALARAAKFGLI